MKFNGRKFTVPIEVIVAVIALSIVVIPSVLHPFKVWVARGVWCVRADAGGNPTVVYGSEVCNPPEASQSE
ncbi:hypothetical protein H6F93_11255 [Leptolyngbya sp. FACHB-671]|uniref:hypothetical protein n=1 Tax=Leptolyngbya sp. FACHB-671 TaxID=2692812 RepID=UPI001682AFB5|nr:hypothetical protein [Leptolyngbya sp. FACHB-671]MBD2068094.1 hypothetical protein [Leptolyngbya sp. FACHB-671]